MFSVQCSYRVLVNGCRFGAGILSITKIEEAGLSTEDWQSVPFDEGRIEDAIVALIDK